MKKREDFRELWNHLLSSKDEDEVIERMTKIVKTFNVDFYKNDIFSNPYFRSLLPEIRDSIIQELIDIKKLLQDEILSIDKELNNELNRENINKFKSLKNDCTLLINEVDIKIEDLKFNLITD